MTARLTTYSFGVGLFFAVVGCSPPPPCSSDSCPAGSSCTASGQCERAADAGAVPPDAGAERDAGFRDAGAPDSGAADAGTADAGRIDAGAGDAGATDAGAQDAGATDAGAQDAGATDAGAQDAGATDAGAEDAGAADAGAPVDAGDLDSGVADAGVFTETCAAPGSLPFATGPDGGLLASLMVDTAGAADNAVGSCVFGVGGRDRVYAFSLTTPKLFSATTRPSPTGDPTLQLRAGTCGAVPAVACADRENPGIPETLRLSLAAGDYFLFVDNYNANANGVQALTVSLTDLPPVPGNDLCSAAQALTFVDGLATVTGDTTSATNGNGPLPDGGPPESPSCSPSAAATGRDLAYSFTVPDGGIVSLAVAAAAGSLLDPIVSIHRPGQCASDLLADELSCGTMLPATALPAGTYTAIVDGRLDTSGPFTLSASLTLAQPTSPPANDLCPQAQPLFDGGTTQQLVASTSLAGNETMSGNACASGVAPDLYYQFTTDHPQYFRAQVTPAFDGGLSPALMLVPLSACGSNGGASVSNLKGCARSGFVGDPITLSVTSLVAGTWLLVVDGRNGTSGAFTLDASLTTAQPTPPDSADCSRPLSITLTPGPFVSRALLSYNFSTIPFVFNTPTVSTRDGGLVNIKAISWTNNTIEDDSIVSIRSACSGGVLGSAFNLGTEVAALAWDRPTGTLHSVWGSNTLQIPGGGPGGPATVQIEVASAPPPNDSCAGAEVLPLNTSVIGHTLGATNDYQGLAPLDGGVGDGGFYGGTVPCGNLGAGPDVVYTFTTAAAGLYRARVRPGRAYDPGLAVLSACAPRSCIDFTDVNGTNLAEVITFAAAANTTYFVVVDSYTDEHTTVTARGGFVVSVESP